MRLSRISALFLCSLALACSGRAPEEKLGTSSFATTTTANSSAMVAGYQHVIGRSRFALGALQTEVDVLGMHKLVGSDGVFATRGSGMVTAMANGASGAENGVPMADNASHNDAVRAYFVGAGLPSDQIASVEDREVVGAATASDGVASGPAVVAFRQTIIRRQINGIPVPDSFAWARLNADGTVVAEQVYWPPIPQSVVLDATNFAAGLVGAGAVAAYEARLPPHGMARGTVIRHSPGEWDQAFVSTAAYDVLPTDLSFPRVRHFDLNGTEIALAFESDGAWGSAPVSTRQP